MKIIEIEDTAEGMSKMTIDMSDWEQNILIREGLKQIIEEEHKNILVLPPPENMGEHATLDLSDDEASALTSIAFTSILRQYVKEREDE